MNKELLVSYHALFPLDWCSSNFYCSFIKEGKSLCELRVNEVRIGVEILMKIRKHNSNC